MERNGQKVDAKFVFGKTVFFLALVIFMVIFSKVFGDQNSLIGVMVIVAALMMLGKDMTVRPFSSLLGLLAINLSLGLGGYVAILNPWAGIAINFAIVFTIIYLMMHDLKMPFWFPFILGYAFILSMPVGAAALPLRMESLAVGAFFIVGLNLIANRGKLKKTCHAGIASLIDSDLAVIDQKLAGQTVDLTAVNQATATTMNGLYDRVKARYFVSGTSKSVLNLAVALEELGQAVAERDIAKEDLNALAAVLKVLKDHENGKVAYAEIHRQLQAFLTDRPTADGRIRSSLHIADFELGIMAERPQDEGQEFDTGEVPRDFRIKTFLKENLTRDSMKFTFAFRLAFMIALWTFIGTYFELENAKWLTFTSIAIVTPYIEGTAKKSVQRLEGTAAGIIVFLLLSPFLTELPMISAAMLIIGFLYTLLNPMGYILQMSFNTVSALLTALMLGPGSPIIWERIAFIVIGVGAALLANRIILPYHLRDETADLAGKYLSAARNQLRDLREVAAGRGDSNRNTALLVNSFAVANKMQLNNTQEPNATVTAFLSEQNEIMLNSSFLKRGIAADGLDEKTRTEMLHLLDTYGPDGTAALPEEIPAEHSGPAGETADLLKRSRRCTELAAEIAA